MSISICVHIYICAHIYIMYVYNESLKVFVCVNFYTYALPRNFLDEWFWRTYSNTFNTQSVHACIVIYMVCMFCLCNVCVFRMSHGEFKIYALCCPPTPLFTWVDNLCVRMCVYIQAIRRAHKDPYAYGGVDGGTQEPLIGATHCNTLQHNATHCYALQLTATHCNICLLAHRLRNSRISHWRDTLQHTATHCYTHRDTL